MSRLEELYGLTDRDYCSQVVPLNGLYHELARDRKSEEKRRSTFPIVLLRQAERFQPQTGNSASFARQNALFRDTLGALVIARRHLTERRLVRIVQKIIARDETRAKEWAAVAELDQVNTLTVPLYNLGRRVLPRGREILHYNDPFMEAFFTDHAYLLRQMAHAVSGSDAARMTVFFATSPLGFAYTPNLHPQTHMQQFTPDSNFGGHAIRNIDVRKMYREMNRRIMENPHFGEFDRSLVFAQVYTGGGKLINFEFDPSNSIALNDQLGPIIGHKKVRGAASSGDGGLFTRSVDQIFEQPEELAGIYLPKGHIRITWWGKRRVTNAERDGLMDRLMKHYHSGSLGDVVKNNNL